MNNKHDVVIVGGGLSGLALAFFLQNRGIHATILEASERPGGRIQTVSGQLGTPLELGATWFSELHGNFLELIAELNLTRYAQYSEGISLFQTKSFEPPQKFYVPAAESPSYRLAGGTQAIIEALVKKIAPTQLHLNKKVVSITNTDEGIIIETSDGYKYVAAHIVICMPPQLAAASITLTPDLPNAIKAILPTVQTWMAKAIKFTLEYDEPLWRRKGYSGMLYSHAGIIVEMYDHTNFEETKYGLTGFLNGGASTYSQNVRKEVVLKQLNDLMGDWSIKAISYFDKIWDNEFITAGQPIITRPHQNNGHPILNAAYMDGKLHFCGTETAKQFAGYMEGAVISAQSVASRLVRLLN